MLAAPPDDALATRDCHTGRWACRFCPHTPYRGASGSLVLPDGRSLRLGSEAVWVGRDPACAIALDDERVSRQHFFVRPVGTGHQLVDTGSGNGTTVNGQRRAYHLLRDGDRIGAGRSTLVYRAYGLSIPLVGACPLPAEPPAALAPLLALYDEHPELPPPRTARCPLCEGLVLPAGEPGGPPRLVQLIVLARHLERCPGLPGSFVPPPAPRRTFHLPGRRGLEVELLPPPADQPEAVVRAESPGGAQVVGLLRVDSRGSAAARLAGELAAHLEHWLAAMSVADALQALDRWLHVRPDRGGCVALSLLEIRTDERQVVFHQAGGMPLLRLRRFDLTPGVCAPIADPPGVVRGGGARFAQASLGWPVGEALVLFTAGLARQSGQDRMLRVLGVLSSGRGVLSLSQLAPSLEARGLGRQGSVLQVRVDRAGQPACAAEPTAAYAELAP